jgi:shikimate dehydrogenase
MEISGNTQICAVIGDPIEHSLSPTMHNAAFSHLKLDYVFLAFKVKTAELANAANGVRGLGIRGLNVTMPHKNAITTYLDEVDPTVKFLGSANTILNRDGRLLGFNTDGVGALRALRENGVSLTGKKVLLLGGGGAAKAVAFSLAEEAEAVMILNRDIEKASVFASAMRSKRGRDVQSDILSSNTIKTNLEDSDVLINATSVGMNPNAGKTLVARGWLKPSLCVMDLVYNPVETRLARDARIVGAKVVNGVEMLLYQGATSFEVWTGCEAPVEVMRKSLGDRLSIAGGAV